MQWNISLWACLVMLPLGCVLGCGNGEDYHPISGSVTFDGQPLDKGVITLYPEGEGTTVGGEIVDGEFSLSRQNGPTPGEYRVEIVAFRPTGKTQFDIDLNEEVDIEEQYLPLKYNRNSELKIEIEEKSENVFPFDLES